MSDRFRAVLLTTLTTVLGLAPLLYERSSQAEFLKPTVITLVFGLGFGMVLVLLVVPAIMAAQADVARAFAALRRGVLGGPQRLRRVLSVAVAGIVLAALALPFWVAATGALPGWFARIGHGLVEASPAVVATVAFVAVAFVLWALAVLVATLRLRADRR